MSLSDQSVPTGERGTSRMQGHWVLAKAGKQVLRPGGRELTERMLAAAEPASRRVVELAPGMGVTAGRILDLSPASYVGVERDPAAAEHVRAVIGTRGRLVEGDAAATGLDEGSADLVVGEAMLTMQGEKTKHAIVAEAHRVLAAGGRYAVHELALRPDDVPEPVKEAVRKDLARAIRVNARPLTVSEWQDLFRSEGFRIEWCETAPMALLEGRRMIADEGVGGVARMAWNMMRDRDMRARIWGMRRTFSQHSDHLCAVSIVAVADGTPEMTSPTHGKGTNA